MGREDREDKGKGVRRKCWQVPGQFEGQVLSHPQPGVGVEGRKWWSGEGAIESPWVRSGVRVGRGKGQDKKPRTLCPLRPVCCFRSQVTQHDSVLGQGDIHTTPEPPLRV